MLKIYCKNQIKNIKFSSKISNSSLQSQVLIKQKQQFKLTTKLTKISINRKLDLFKKTIQCS